MGQVSVATKVDPLDNKVKRSNIFEKLITAETLEIKEKDIGTDTIENSDIIIDLDEESDDEFDYVPDD
ncbi:hypothetical protein [Chryseobacterium sp. Marseille-Q8038]